MNQQDYRAPDAAGLAVVSPKPISFGDLAAADRQAQQNPEPQTAFIDGGQTSAFNGVEPEPALDDDFGDDISPPPDDDEYAEQEQLPIVTQAPRDPNASVAAALMAAGRWYEDAKVLIAALRKHLGATAGEPELHAFLSRLELLAGEVTGTIDSLESGMSDRLRQAIIEAVAA